MNNLIYGERKEPRLEDTERKPIDNKNVKRISSLILSITMIFSYFMLRNALIEYKDKNFIGLTDDIITAMLDFTYIFLIGFLVVEVIYPAIKTRYIIILTTSFLLLYYLFRYIILK